MPFKQEVVEQCRGTWKVDLTAAPCSAPLQCCFGGCCICCASYMQRDELLTLTNEPYVCCAGLFPCGPLGEPCDKSCLCLEVCCCPGLALSANRFMVQTRFDKENTPCDDYIITATFCFACCVSIARCFLDVPDELQLLADCLVMTVQGCMHAQQAIEIDDVKKNGYHGPPSHIVQIFPDSHKQWMGQPGGGGMQPPQQYGMGQQNFGGPPQMMMEPGGPPGGGAPGVTMVRCGGCGQTFGAPGRGMTIACPHCGTHNSV